MSCAVRTLNSPSHRLSAQPFVFLTSTLLTSPLTPHCVIVAYRVLFFCGSTLHQISSDRCVCFHPTPHVLPTSDMSSCGRFLCRLSFHSFVFSVTDVITCSFKSLLWFCCLITIFSELGSSFSQMQRCLRNTRKFHFHSHPFFFLCMFVFHHFITILIFFLLKMWTGSCSVLLSVILL